MVRSKFVENDVVEEKHLLHTAIRFGVLRRLRPLQPVTFLGLIRVEVHRYLLIAAVGTHPEGHRTALFLDHGQVFQVLVRIKKQLACVKFY